MLTVWLIIGVLLLLVTFSTHGFPGGCLMVPVAIAVWLVIGLVLLIGWMVFSGSGDDDCWDGDLGTACTSE